MEHADVVRWLKSARTATLCTVLHDDRAAGFPFGTVVPFDVDDAGTVSIVVSDLAVHTKNLERDPRASIVVAEPHDDAHDDDAHDPQAGWRVTLVGTMRKLPGEARADLPGFRRFVLDVKATRYIAGFGTMGWL